MVCEEFRAEHDLDFSFVFQLNTQHTLHIYTWWHGNQMYIQYIHLVFCQGCPVAEHRPAPLATRDGARRQGAGPRAPDAGAPRARPRPQRHALPRRIGRGSCCTPGREWQPCPPGGGGLSLSRSKFPAQTLLSTLWDTNGAVSSLKSVPG